MTETAPHTRDNDQTSLLHLKIVPQEKGTLFVDIASLARVLTAVGGSLESFLWAELLGRFRSPKPALKKEIAKMVSLTRLVLTGTAAGEGTFKFGLAAFTDAIKFNLLKDTPELRHQLFTMFLNDVFTPLLFSTGHIENLCRRYGAKERVKIFGPVFTHLANPALNYQVHFSAGASRQFCSWELPPEIETISHLIPEVVKKAGGESTESYYQYIKTGEINDLFGKRSKYEKVLIKESAKHDLYPYELQKIRVQGKTYRFSETLSAPVVVENGLYRITLSGLQLSASHPSRLGAEKEFETALASLVLQLEKEDSSAVDAKTRAKLIQLRSLLV